MRRIKDLTKGTNFEDFIEDEEEKSNLFDDVDGPRGDKQDSGANVDWFGTFPSPLTGDDDGDVTFGYWDNNDIYSLDWSDSGVALNRRRYLEFNENNMHDDVNLNCGLIFSNIQLARNALR